MDEKAFQLITWDIDEKDKNDITIKSKVFDDVEQMPKEKIDTFPIAIGLNPSNKTDFNEDETNLYLKDMIKKKFNSSGYILTNLCPKIEPDSKKISKQDFDENHIKKVITLIDLHVNSKIVIFWGKTGNKYLNKNIIKCMKELKNKLVTRQNNNLLYYTCANDEFIHPGRRKDNYSIKEISDMSIFD